MIERKSAFLSLAGVAGALIAWLILFASAANAQTAQRRICGVALKITSDQESAWQAYASVAKTQADARLEQRKAMYGAAPATAAERFDLHNKFMKEHFQQLEAVNAAFKDLYAALTPEQRAIADQGAGFGPGFRGPGGRAR